MSLKKCLFSCCAIPPLETLPSPRDPSVEYFTSRLICLQRKHLALWIFLNNVFFHGEALLAPGPTPKQEDHTLSAVRDCLFNIFAATSISEAVPPSATWGRAVPWWQVPTYHGCNSLGYKNSWYGRLAYLPAYWKKLLRPSFTTYHTTRCNKPSVSNL